MSAPVDCIPLPETIPLSIGILRYTYATEHSVIFHLPVCARVSSKSQSKTVSSSVPSTIVLNNGDAIRRFGLSSSVFDTVFVFDSRHELISPPELFSTIIPTFLPLCPNLAREQAQNLRLVQYRFKSCQWHKFYIL